MSKLFDVASAFAKAIAGTPRNCYWYGSASILNGQIVPTPKAANPCNCIVPESLPAAGANIGWPTSGDRFALVGWDPDGHPLAFTDCTGFAEWAIRQTSPDDAAAFHQWEQSHTGFARHPEPWPSAAAYAVAGYASGPIGGNWSVVANTIDLPEAWVAGVQPGDLLAWDIQEVPGQANDTGHIMVVSAPIQRISATDYRVEVIDSSRLLHGNDSRGSGTGVGTGFILLQYGAPGASGWQYNFGDTGDHSHTAPHIAVLRLNV